MTASKLQPALIAGVAIGLLSGIPIVNIGNCCCCLWVVSGGALAAYLLQQRQASPIDLGDAALVGLMAGVIGAVVSTVISMPFAMMSGAMNQQAAIDALSSARDLPPEAREYVERLRGFLSGGGAGAAIGIIGFFFSLIIDAIFATLGGLIGGLVFKKKLDASLPPPPPPFMA